MSKNLIQALIDERPASDWLAHLVDAYKIVAIPDRAGGEIVSLHYNQIESPMDEPIVQQCRGMVVDTAARKVVAWPYDKFWNIGEPGAAAIDWSTASVLEKLDGSLMILYHHARHGFEGEWRVATSSHPTAGGPYGLNSTMTYRDVFWQVFEGTGMKRPDPSWGPKLGMPLEAYTFMFELCAPTNRLVVRYPEPKIVLHGARHLATGNELARPGLQLIAAEHNWPLVDARPLQVPGATWASPEAEAADKARGCIEAAKLLDPTATEGFVVIDAAFRRVKIKSPKYVRLHALKNNGVVSPRRAIDLWLSGEAAEVLAVFPELAPQITPIHERLAQIAEQAHADTGFHRQNTTSRKEFASSVAKLPHAAVCFKLYTLVEPSVADAEKIMRGMSPSALERLVMVDIEWIGYDASVKPSAVAVAAGAGETT